MAFIRALLLGTMALLVFMLITWLERKVVARIQDRIGPNLAGPWGLLQPIADGIKAITKEDTTPNGADVTIFNASPIVAGVAALLVYAVIPFGPSVGVVDLNIGLLFFLGMSSLGVYSVALAGWRSDVPVYPPYPYKAGHYPTADSYYDLPPYAAIKPG
ncbi:MAG: NADH-quinone oxidoreductase subunit H, partial [Chloroflexi bacterium]|nr:NADH-quinone oxidoreductase subunit H [Chloroflexota bacterium]